MKKVIIGIHGLGNKPPRDLLRKWWEQSIREGLKKIGRDRLYFNFEMVYWADILHKTPLDQNDKNKKSEFFIENPYVPSRDEIQKKPDESRKKILDFIEKQIDKIFLNDDLTLNYSFVTDLIINHFFKDLESYFLKRETGGSKPPRPVKDAIDHRLEKILRKHSGKEILLLSHSMGSIIAYGVLRHNGPEMQVDTFVTMGSPLGLPIIMAKVAAERAGETGTKPEAKTPESVVNGWYNFSDLDDKIAINYNLGDDYEANSRNIRAQDSVVYNDYEINGKRNPHKSYGYLRTPEMAMVIDDFLIRGRNRIAVRAEGWICRLIDRYNEILNRKG